MKKIYLFLLILILCSSCGNGNIPADLKDFVNGIDFRNVKNHLRSGEFEQDYIEKINGEIAGKNHIDFEFSIFEDDINFHAIYTFEGTQIKNDISSKEIVLKHIGIEEYSLEVTTNIDYSIETLTYEKAHEKFYKIYDSGTNPYRFGGLYYGDYFALNMNNFYHLYSVNKEKTVLTLKETDAPYYNKLSLTQQIDIDKNGMLLYKSECAKDQEELNTGLLIQTAKYIYD